MSQRIVPFLGYEDAAGAIDFLERAFGFREDRDERREANGTITHAQLDLDGATIFLSTPPGYASPKTIRAESEAAKRAGENPWVIDGHCVRVDDFEAHYERAKAAGARIIREPEDPGLGHRIYTAEDPEGHRWMFEESDA